jgi:hypothetical protein
MDPDRDHMDVTCRYNIQTTYYMTTPASPSTPQYISNSVAFAGATYISNSTRGNHLNDTDILNIVRDVLDQRLLPLDAEHGVYFVLTASGKQVGSFLL